MQNTVPLRTNNNLRIRNISNSQIDVLQRISDVGESAQRILNSILANNPTNHSSSSTLNRNNQPKFFNNQNVTISFQHKPSNTQGRIEIPASLIKDLLVKAGNFLLSLINWLKEETINWISENPKKTILAAAIGTYLGIFYLATNLAISSTVSSVLSTLGISESVAATIGGAILGGTSAFILLRFVIKIGEVIVDYIKNDTDSKNVDTSELSSAINTNVIDITDHLLLGWPNTTAPQLNQTCLII